MIVIQEKYNISSSNVHIEFFGKFSTEDKIKIKQELVAKKN